MDRAIPWPEHHLGSKCRKIAEVLVPGTAQIIYFYGQKITQYYEADYQRIEGELSVGLNCAQKGRGFETGLAYTENKEKAKKDAVNLVTTYAGAMKGMTVAYCDAGRERSALAVFSHLHVNLKVDRDKARDLVVEALKASYHPHHPERQKHITQTEERLDSVVAHLP